MRDIIGLHLAPPDRALVLCVDEKPPIQAAQGTAPALPLRPGQAERRTHDHRRHGTLDLCAALDVRAGTAVGARERHRRSVAFRAFLDRVESSVPPGLEVHLVPDNLRTHKTWPIHDRLVKRPHCRLHFTPTSASWLNLIECGLALLSRRRLERGALTSTGNLEEAILSYPELHRGDQCQPKTVRVDQDRGRAALAASAHRLEMPFFKAKWKMACMVSRSAGGMDIYFQSSFAHCTI